MRRFLFGAFSTLVLLFACSAEKTANVAQQTEETTPIQLSEPPRGPSNKLANDNPSQICEGKLQTTVAPRVLKFLSCEVAQILLQPDYVESFLLEPHKKPDLDEMYRLGPYPIRVNGQGRNLEGENLEKFQKLVFDEKSYVFEGGMVKRCRFTPDAGLHFVKGDKAVEVLFSVSCNLWMFIDEKEKKLEDFDPISKKLIFLNVLFE